MTKEKTTTNLAVTPSVLPTNYEALEYITWFMTDAQNVQNWAGTIFRGGFSTDDPRFIELLKAANKAITETEDDIAKIKEFLAAYVPPNNN